MGPDPGDGAAGAHAASACPEAAWFAQGGRVTAPSEAWPRCRTGLCTEGHHREQRPPGAGQSPASDTPPPPLSQQAELGGGAGGGVGGAQGGWGRHPLSLQSRPPPGPRGRHQAGGRRVAERSPGLCFAQRREATQPSVEPQSQRHVTLLLPRTHPRGPCPWTAQCGQRSPRLLPHPSASAPLGRIGGADFSTPSVCKTIPSQSLDLLPENHHKIFTLPTTQPEGYQNWAAQLHTVSSQPCDCEAS